MSDGGHFIAFAAERGITPVLPIIETLLARNARAQVQLFFGKSAQEQLDSTEQLLSLKDRYLDRLALHFVVSDEPQDIELFNGKLDANKVTAVAGRFFDPRSVRQFIVCGPGVTNDEIGDALQNLGVPPAHIHFESYGSQSATAQTPLASPAAPLAANMTEVTVIMDGRRRSFSMRTEEESVLDAAERAGLNLPFSCRAGVCSTCRTKVLRGEVALTQNYALEDWELEQGFILACQAHAKTPELEITYDEI